MKMNCPTCLEPISFAAVSATQLEKCPTCNNAIDVPESVKLESAAPVSEPAAVSLTAANASGAVAKAEVEKGSSPEFSFRIAGSVALMLLFLFSAIIFAGLSLVLYLQPADAEPMLVIRDTVFKGMGVSGPSDYTLKVAGGTVGASLLLAFLGLIVLVAISKRKRILAITVLTLLVLIGFVIGTPFVAILCLILVSVPGRSDIWVKSA